MSQINNRVFLPILFALVSVFSMIIGMRLDDSLKRDGLISDSNSDTDHLTAIYEATEHIRAKYYADTLKETFTDDVISNMVDQLDPYSHYFESHQDERYNQYMSGKFKGIGVEFIPYRDSMYIFKVIDGSPAQTAGLKRGDRLLHLNDIPITGAYAKVDSVHRLIQRSQEMIILEVQDILDGKKRKLELKPDDIRLPLVEDFAIQHEGGYISYVKIHRFYNEVYKDFMQALEDHTQDQNGTIKHLIIDVRDNPGGLVDETVKILNQFFTEKDKILLETRSRNSRNQEYTSNGRIFIDVDRIVVLCNEQSASASEILAGVLQDYDKAVIMGSHTYGKGLIQQNYDLSNKGSINLSIGEYILPSGRRIYGSVDSSYTSLESNRVLPQSPKGIGPDIKLVHCLEKTSLRSAKEKSIAQNAWRADQIRSFSMSAEQHSDSCASYHSHFIRWELLKNVIALSDTISQQDVDHQIQEAVELIVSTSYDQHLTGKD